ncbi:MAB_1171c family putative transporter [Streptomyces niveiscabiei]|uniref:MAB_1171c family putative transporter n=1 Tax=Streptomyces niveiscabiei TaxID=164115 RepID=UPI0006EBBFC2|nr:MAB_1171c family putative transporter [Streptomyces niveiscabiei]
MSVSDLIATFILALLLLQAAVRLPGALRGRRRSRSLSGAFIAFALAWWLRTDLGRTTIDPLGVNDLPTLLKHILAIAGICVLLMYVCDVYAEEDASARHIRVSALVQRATAYASLATVVCLTAVFFLVLDRSKTAKDSPYFIGRHMGDRGLALYMDLFYAYVVAAALVCAYQWGRAARRASHWSLRTGLTMMTAGMTLIVVYAVMRTVFLTAATFHPLPARDLADQEHVTDTVLYAGFLLWLLGSIVPALRALLARVHSTRAVVRLHPLWRDLALAVDGIALYQPATLLRGHRAAAPLSTLRDVLSHDATPQVRLGRYVTEIRDATHELRRRAPADLYERAVRFAEAQGHRGADAEAAAEAYWLKAALPAARHPAGAPTAFRTAGDDFTTEVSWLMQVARAYRRTDFAPVPLPEPAR